MSNDRSRRAALIHASDPSSQTQLVFMTGKRRAEEGSCTGGGKGQRSIRSFFAPAVGAEPQACAVGALQRDTCTAATTAGCHQLPDRAPPPAGCGAAPRLADSCRVRRINKGSSAVSQSPDQQRTTNHVAASAGEECGELPAAQQRQPTEPPPTELPAQQLQPQAGELQQQQQVQPPEEEQQAGGSASMDVDAPAKEGGAAAGAANGGDRSGASSSGSGAHAGGGGGGGGLTAYELQRLERIRRNQEVGRGRQRLE